MLNACVIVSQRANILNRLAELVLDREQEIHTANAEDLREAGTLSDSLRSRLKLTHEKLQSLSSGLRQLAEKVVQNDHVGHVIKRTQVGEGLTLEQQKVPIGVLLVIFESRPDCLIQVHVHNSVHGLLSHLPRHSHTSVFIIHTNTSS